MPPIPIPSLKILLIWTMVLFVLSESLFVTSYMWRITSVIFKFLTFSLSHTQIQEPPKPLNRISLSLSLSLSPDSAVNWWMWNYSISNQETAIIITSTADHMSKNKRTSLSICSFLRFDCCLEMLKSVDFATLIRIPLCFNFQNPITVIPSKTYGWNG